MQAQLKALLQTVSQPAPHPPPPTPDPTWISGLSAALRPPMGAGPPPNRAGSIPAGRVCQANEGCAEQVVHWGLTGTEKKPPLTCTEGRKAVKGGLDALGVHQEGQAGGRQRSGGGSMGGGWEAPPADTAQAQDNAQVASVPSGLTGPCRCS